MRRQNERTNKNNKAICSCVNATRPPAPLIRVPLHELSPRFFVCYQLLVFNMQFVLCSTNYDGWVILCDAKPYTKGMKLILNIQHINVGFVREQSEFNWFLSCVQHPKFYLFGFCYFLLFFSCDSDKIWAPICVDLTLMFNKIFFGAARFECNLFERAFIII